VGALMLLFTKPLSISFYVIFALCAISDAIDGTIARKTGTDSKSGEILDSVADFIFVIAFLIVLMPVLSFTQWMLYWILIIVLLRITTFVIGLVKYKAFASLHTYTAKVSAGIIYSFPVLLYLIGLNTTVVIACILASISVMEEIIITIRSDRLDRNINGIFDLK
jgi:CDP-diacylglycerol--glycerol-3-phosphate 3-phosphatidyltransferase